MILCDTNVLIEFYKGNSEIIDELQKVVVDKPTLSGC